MENKEINIAELETYFRNDFIPSDLVDVFNCSEETLTGYYDKWKGKSSPKRIANSLNIQNKIKKYAGRGFSIDEVCKLTGLSKSTVYKYGKSLREQGIVSEPIFKGSPTDKTPRGRKTNYKKSIEEQKNGTFYRCLNLYDKGHSPAEIVKLVGIGRSTADRYYYNWAKCQPEGLNSLSNADIKRAIGYEFIDLGYSTTQICELIDLSRSRVCHLKLEREALKIYGVYETFMENVKKFEKSLEEERKTLLDNHLEEANVNINKDAITENTSNDPILSCTEVNTSSVDSSTENTQTFKTECSRSLQEASQLADDLYPILDEENIPDISSQVTIEGLSEAPEAVEVPETPEIPEAVEVPEAVEAPEAVEEEGTDNVAVEETTTDNKTMESEHQISIAESFSIPMQTTGLKLKMREIVLEGEVATYRFLGENVTIVLGEGNQFSLTKQQLLKLIQEIPELLTYNIFSDRTT